MSNVEWYYPAGEDVVKRKETGIWADEDRLQITTLKRNGFCGYCTKVVHASKDQVITFRDSHNKMQKVVLCIECAERISKLLEGYNNDNKR